MVYVFLAEGFEEVEALTIVDYLRRGGVEVNTVSISESLEVMGTHDVEVKADLLMSEADFDKCCMIVLPGGLPGADYLCDCIPLRKQIQRFATEGAGMDLEAVVKSGACCDADVAATGSGTCCCDVGAATAAGSENCCSGDEGSAAAEGTKCKMVAAICAAPRVLAAAGILEGKKVTCYPGVEKALGNVQYLTENVVVDGNIITSRGPSTAVCFALKLLTILKGDAVMQEVKAGLLL